MSTASPLPRRVGVAVTLGVIVVGVLAMWESAKLDVGTPSAPGPGAWPLLASGVMVLCGVLLLVTERTTDDYERIDRESWVVGAAIGSLLVFMVLLEAVGMMIVGALLMTFWVHVLGRQPWRTTLLVALLAPTAAWAVFVAALGVPLPVWPPLLVG